jgi:glycosyltransferase involved in cell wall biosynthesis
LIERGVPASKIELIYNWAEEDIFRPEPRNTCLAQTLRLEGKFNVLYTGNFGPFQRLDVAIEAATRVQHLDQFQLVLIGSGHCETELRGQAERLGAKNVRFIGRQEYAEMGTITNLADVLLVSLDDLPFFAATIPSKTQVALACGRPLLVAARGDAADLVERAGAGMTCAPADAGSLAAAFEAMYGLGASELNSMGTRGREFYERELSLQRGAERTEAVLAEVAKTGRAWSVGR